VSETWSYPRVGGDVHLVGERDHERKAQAPAAVFIVLVEGRVERRPSLVISTITRDRTRRKLHLARCVLDGVGGSF